MSVYAVYKPGYRSFSGYKRGLTVEGAPVRGCGESSLYRGRRRAVLRLMRVALWVALAIVIGVASAAVMRSPASAESASAPVERVVTVEAGHTLWSIAEELAGEEDPRNVMLEIAQLNDLSSSDLQPGQKLRIPDTID